MADLPLILAGPILRRVEPRLVCVWIALREARAVVLDVFEGRQQTGGGDAMFLGRGPVRGGANTLRLGDRLHVAVVVAEMPAESARPLVPGLNYSYNLGFAAFAATAGQAATLDPEALTATDDLKSEKLLRDGPLADRPHLALGYEAGELPGFALPPPSLTDLRLLHGSCRRPGYAYPDDDDGTKSFDGLAWVDDLILEWRRGSSAALPFDANVRPHQLFLTGDQIYADDVASPLLPMLNRVGTGLIGALELLPTRYPPRPDPQSMEEYLNAPKQPGFERLQAFVDKKRAEGKDPLAELKKDRQVRVLRDPCFDRAFGFLFGRPYTVDSDVARDSDKRGLCRWPADLRHFPARLRKPILQCEGQLSAGDLESHLVSFGEYCAMYLAVWCNAAWELGSGGAPALAGSDEVLAIPSGSLPQIWDFHACFGKDGACIARTDRAALEARMQEIRAKPDTKAGFAKTIATLNGFYQSLPRVRRGLANVPTYMMFDDHDVTDDWNLGRAWRDRVLTASLGRRVLTSALVAYAVFQDWGNDPLRYRRQPYRDLLDRASEYQPASVKDPPATHPTVRAAARLEELFGFDQPDPEKPPPLLKWHFTVDGPRHRVVALDTRTRRVFRSRYLPPGLLSPKALSEQLPDPREQPLPAGVDVLVVLSATPAVLPSLATRVILPLKTRLEEFSNHESWRRLVGLEPDNEVWPGDDAAYEAFLRRLAEYRRVVVLSGEVHYGSSGQLSYWKKGRKRLDLPSAVRPDLDRPDRIPSPALRDAFRDGGSRLSGASCLSPREGNDEWLVIDVGLRRMFLVRQEADGLNVYEEEEPARIAQFVSSGLLNVKKTFVTYGALLGFAFALTDLTPAERLIWQDSTPTRVRPAPGGRLPPVVRDRLGSEPVLVPSGNWSPGTTLESLPDFAWRAEAIRDERPDGERPEFARADSLPEFDPSDVPASYGAIADRHAAHIEKFRFARGAMYRSNLGLVRFELDEERVVARHDLYTHRPDRHEAVAVSTHRVPLQPFGEERPKLRFDLPVGD